MPVPATAPLAETDKMPPGRVPPASWFAILVPRQAPGCTGETSCRSPNRPNVDMRAARTVPVRRRAECPAERTMKLCILTVRFWVKVSEFSPVQEVKFSFFAHTCQEIGFRNRQHSLPLRPDLTPFSCSKLKGMNQSRTSPEALSLRKALP